MSEQVNPAPDEIPLWQLPPEAPKSPKRSIFRRVGCGILIVLWFLFILSPCLLIILASQGEIVLQHRNIPESEIHPLLRVDLIMDIDFRGMAFTNSTKQNESDLEMCVQTNVRYLLWEGEGESAKYCDCYSRISVDKSWESTITTVGECESG